MMVGQYLRLAIFYQESSVHFRSIGRWALADFYCEAARRYLQLAKLEALK